MFPCVFVTFPYDASGQVWYLILSISDLCLLLNFWIQCSRSFHLFFLKLNFIIFKASRSQTQNNAQRLADCGHVSASSQSLHFILSLRMKSSFITSRPGVITIMVNECAQSREEGIAHSF